MNLSRAYFLYKALAHNQRLQSRRHPMFEKNRVMKLFSYVFIAFIAAYLSALGVSLYSLFANTSFEAFDWIDGGMIWFLLADFLLRFFLRRHLFFLSFFVLVPTILSRRRLYNRI